MNSQLAPRRTGTGPWPRSLPLGGTPETGGPAYDRSAAGPLPAATPFVDGLLIEELTDDPRPVPPSICICTVDAR